MYKFRASQRLGMMVFMVSRMKQVSGKGVYGTRFGKFRVVVGELDLES